MALPQGGRINRVATPSSDLRSRAGLTVVDGRSPSLSSHDVPAGLRMVRALDRAVLEAARRCALRPMELYALLLLRSAVNSFRRRPG